MADQRSLTDRPGAIDYEYAEVLEEISRRIQIGKAVDVEKYLNKYPQYADKLRQVLPAMQTMVDLGISQAESSTSPDFALDTEQNKLGDFRILREVGHGGMGIVYEAEQISLSRKVALKVLPLAAVLDPRRLKRFTNEAKAVATLHHSNIVPVFSVGCDRGVHYYAMQFIDGQSLADILAEMRRGTRR